MLLCNSGFSAAAQDAILASLGLSENDRASFDFCEGRGREAKCELQDNISGYPFNFVEPSSEPVPALAAV